MNDAQTRRPHSWRIAIGAVLLLGLYATIGACEYPGVPHPEALSMAQGTDSPPPPAESAAPSPSEATAETAEAVAEVPAANEPPPESSPVPSPTQKPEEAPEPSSPDVSPTQGPDVAGSPTAVAAQETEASEGVGHTAEAEPTPLPTATPLPPPSPTPVPTPEPTPEPEAPSVFEISLKDFNLDPDTATVKAGLVTFVLTNDGRYTHDFRVEGQGVDEKAPKVGRGRSKEWQITLEPGEYQISCPISNHASRGMTGTLVVVP